MDKQEALDAVEDTIDGVVDVVTVVRGNPKLIVAAAVGGVVVGATGGYFVTKKLITKNLRLHYEEIAEREIAEAKKFYSKLHKTDEYSDPEVLAADLGLATEASVRYGSVEINAETPAATEEELQEELEEVADLIEGEMDRVDYTAFHKQGETSTSTDDEPKVEVKVTNIFASQQVHPEVRHDDFDYDEELARRNGDTPYVIHHDEFMEGEKDYEQQQLTYFKGDDILIDNRDEVVQDTEATVGDSNLLRFGHGSKDRNIVYVRNDRIELDFEIVQDEGSYTEKVLGFLEHSDTPRRFRSSDG